MNKPADIKVATADQDFLSTPMVVPAEAYISPDYAKAEFEKLWSKTWLQAGRVEDIPNPGDFITFEIVNTSVIIQRAEDGAIRAFHNVCPHRGRRLIDTPKGQRNARGTKKNIVCGYHGWTFNQQGKCVFIAQEQDWQDKLTEERTSLGKVQVDTWGGWLWINLDPAAGPLRAYLEPAASMLDPYHVQTTHPEFNAFAQFRGWGRNQGLHSNIGYDTVKGLEEDSGKMRVGLGDDPRVATAEMQNYTWENANTNTTQTLVDVANRLKDELPEGTPAAEVSAYWIRTAREEDAARGVEWAAVEPSHTMVAGTSWQVFPNFQIGHAVQNMLCYSARPYGNDPDKCIFEGVVYQLWAEGEAPETEWEYTSEKEWPPVLQQDFDNMAAVQQGMKNIGFRGAQPNPYMERAVASLHHNLARYMGTGDPQPIELATPIK